MDADDPHPNGPDQFDLIVIGAGINGAGIARDAALRGLRVLLLDQGDICSGTSSWSSRLIHGGLRYLEHGELGLVRESLRERERLLHNAPHLVRPLAMMLPIYRGARRGTWTIRAGMVSYDLLSAGKSLPGHTMLSAEETLDRAPGLRAAGLRGAAQYYDAQVEFAERLVLENALDAAAHGAEVITYACVTRILSNGGAVTGVEYSDQAGQVRNANTSIVLNVAGPWVDQVLEGAGATEARLIGGTKGSHIIVAPFPGAPTVALYVEAESDGRPFFILPWNDLYLIGTTDEKFAGDLDHLEATEPEIEYLLRETNRVIPSADLTRDSIVYTYAGVRPLPYDPAESAGDLSRRHFIRDHGGKYEGLISIIGGKLTTYRELAEEAVDLVFRKLGIRDPGSSTGNAFLPGATADFDQFCLDFHREHAELSQRTRAHLLCVYGVRADVVLQIAADARELREIIDPESGAIGAEVVFAFRSEMAQNLTDCLLRRTMIGLNRFVGLNVVETAAKVGVAHLDWSSEHAAEEVAGYRAYVARFHPREI